MTRAPGLHVRLAAAGFAASLAVLGWIVGHAGAYSFAPPTHDAEALESAHGYMTPLKTAALTGAILALLLFAVAVRRSPRMRSRPSLQPLSPLAFVAFAVVPSVACVLVELVEHGWVGQLPSLRTLVAGVLLQLPLGPIAALAARWLLRAVEQLVATRAGGRSQAGSEGRRPFPLVGVPFRLRPLRGAIAGRAPPLLG